MARRQVVSDQVFQYGFSGWDPSALCGNNFLAAYLHSPIQPAIFLAHFFPLWLVNGLIQILFTFFAGYGMFLYFHRILKCSPFSSFIGGIFFIGLTVEYQQDRPLVFLFPMFLYLFYSWNCFTWIRKIGYILFFYFCFTISHTQFSLPFFPLLHALDFFFISKPEKLTRLSFFKRFFLLWTIYGFIHAPTLYTFLTEGFISHRTLVSASSHFPNVKDLFKLLSQTFFKNFFGTLIPCSTMLITLFFLKYSRIRFCWLMVFLLILARWFLNEVPFSLEIGPWRPFIVVLYQAMKMDRFFELWIPFLYCILATYGIFFLEKIKKDAPMPVNI